MWESAFVNLHAIEVPRVSTQVSHEDTVLLTTYFDAPCGSDYEGDAWVGNSHESDGAGIARHCLPWIERVCAERGLAAADLGRGLGQTWLRIMNASTELLRWPRRDPTWGALPTCARAPADALLRAWRAALADLPEDILFYILHMCHSKWAPPLPKPTMLTALADAKSTQLVKKKATSFVRSVRKSIAGLFRRKSTTAPAPAAD